MTERQKLILNQLMEATAKGALATSSGMARELDVTSRTIQTDIKALDAELAACGTRIETVPGKGYRLNIGDSNRLYQLLNTLANDDELRAGLGTQDDRVRYVIDELLFAHEPVLSDMLAYGSFISRSQLSLDLREAREVLGRYNLELKNHSRRGLAIEGDEADKRSCMVREQIARQRCLDAVGNHKDVVDIVLDALSQAEYDIPDLDLQNLVVILETALARIRSRFELQGGTTPEERSEYARELRIARSIFDGIDARFGIYGNDRETLALATVIRGSHATSTDELIAEDTEAYVLELLHELRERYGIDFTNDAELRISLALHLSPLVARAKGNLLSSNPLLGSIKESMPLAYDLGVTAAHLIELHYNVFLNEDEAGHLALYFGIAQKNLSERRGGKRVLVITSSRTSDSLLLRFNFTKLFGDLIDTIDVVQADRLDDIDPRAFDAVFSTVDAERTNVLKRPVVQVNYFLTERDRWVVREVLSATDANNGLKGLFVPELFFGGMSFASKEEALRFLCGKLAEACPTSGDLFEAVMRREQLATTSFSDLVALPHPDAPLTERTAVAAAVLDKPLDWGGGKRIEFIFLFAIKAHGESELEDLYGFLAWFMQNRAALARLHGSPSYETFAEVLASYVPATEGVPL